MAGIRRRFATELDGKFFSNSSGGILGKAYLVGMHLVNLILIAPPFGQTAVFSL